MRLVLISDTHTLHDSVAVPDGDVLIHAGDFCGHGTVREAGRFLEWFARLPHTHKVAIPGNHDICTDAAHARGSTMQAAKVRAGFFGVATLFVNSSVALRVGDEAILVHGSPCTPEFCGWAWMYPESFLAEMWRRIPGATDVLVTHGPAHGYGDLNLEGEHCGSTSLRDWLQAQAKVRPIPLHVFGHIHEAAGQGVYPWGGRWVNASVLNRRYEVANAPVVVEFEAGEVAA